MPTRANTYQLTLAPLMLASGVPATRPTLQLEIRNHDELFTIMDRLATKSCFATPQQAAEFGLGLKLFSEVLLACKNEPVFQRFIPAFTLFVRELKQA